MVKIESRALRKDDFTHAPESYGCKTVDEWLLVRGSATRNLENKGATAVKRWGFTLIEVLLAVSISAVIIVSLTAAFWRGSDAYRRSKGLDRISKNIRFPVSIMNKEIANSVRLPQQIENDIEANLKEKLQDSIELKEGYFINKDEKDRIIFFTIKKFLDDEISHIYKVSYRIKENAENGNYLLQRAQTQKEEVSNFDEMVNHTFDDDDYKTIMEDLDGEDLEFFEVSPFGGTVEFGQKEETSEEMSKISIVQEDNLYTFPFIGVYILAQPGQS